MKRQNFTSTRSTLLSRKITTNTWK